MASAIDLGEVVAMRIESLQLSEQSMRCTFTWNDVEDIACVGKPEAFGRTLDAGGWERSRAVAIEFRLELLPDGVGTPQPNHHIFYKSHANATPIKYRILQTKAWYGATMELECVDPNSGDAT